MTDSSSPGPKTKFTESEQELFDALLDEYNDVFENILNISEKNMFDKILVNVKAILGAKKMSSYAKMTIAKVLSSLKLLNYLPDITSLKHLKEIMISLGNKDRTNKMPVLKINEIFSHCKECSKCYHTCGEVLLKPSAFDFIICLKCKMVYKKELIHLFCNECKEEYYSYVLDDSEPEYDDYYPATWEKYHCKNFIYEEMTCPKCDSMLYYNENNDILKCFECKWKCLAKDKKWVCEICDAEFKSEVKEYIRFETKPMVNCVRDALVQKVLARPAEMTCCDGDPRYFNFIHEEKGCKGTLYLGLLQKKEMAVCSECRLVQPIKDVFWHCPNCKTKFYCKKINSNVSKNKNCYMIRPKSLIKTDESNLFKSKKMLNYHKSERNIGKIDDFRKSQIKAKIDNKDNKVNKMEKSITSDIIKAKKNIIDNLKKSDLNEDKIKNITKLIANRNNILKPHNTEQNSKEESPSSREKQKEEISSDDDVEKRLKQVKTRKIYTSFYKKPKSYFSENMNFSKEKSKEKTKEKEKDKEKENDNQNIKDKDFADNINLNKTPEFKSMHKENNKSSFYSNNRKSTLNQPLNLSLREMKLLSVKNQKYINKSKIKFDKSINEVSSTKNSNKNLYAQDEKIKDLKKYNKDKIVDKRINLNLNLNININNYLARSNSIKNYHTLENRLRNKTISKSYLNLKNINNFNNKLKQEEIEPNENFIPEDFKTIRQIGEGSFGKIYCSEWKINKKKYAMKKMILRNKIEIKKNQDQTDLVYDLVKQTNIKGVIKVYGAQCIKINSAEYHFYVLMELAEIDWEKEIKKRKESKNYYTEGELFDILKQLIQTFAFLQKNNITHRDIKPQNVLVVNKIYKVCDFGEAKVTDGNNVIHQTIKGTELYMSPILFRALNKRQSHLIHNTYKSDVFSLGMCLFLAATLTFQSLYDIRELNDMEVIKNILVKYLIAKYSYDFVHILIKMLEVNEELRPDFIELENILSKK